MSSELKKIQVTGENFEWKNVKNNRPKLQKSFTSEELRQHTLKNAKQCPRCDSSFNTAIKMRRHCKNIHNLHKCTSKLLPIRLNTKKQILEMGVVQKKKYECAHCCETYVGRVAFVKHMSVHAGDICKSLKLDRVFEEHHVRVVKEASEEFVETGRITIKEWIEMVKQRIKTCPLCKKTYTTAKDMRRHVREVHSTARPYTCDLCGKSFKSERHISQHKRRLHLGIKKVVHFNFECFHCGAKFNSRTNLADHMTSHTGIKNHVCGICQSTYTTARGLRRHNKNHLRDTGILSAKEMYKCDKCDKLFIEHSEMVKHRDWVHGDKCSLCKVCGARVKGNIKEHMRIHTGERPICCHICGKKLRGKLREHLMTHSEEKPFGCQMCGSAFKNKYYLAVHMRKHTGERPYVCNYCGHSFAARSAFTLHLKRHTEHGYIKNFECQICKNRFPSEETLDRHLTEHFGLSI